MKTTRLFSVLCVLCVLSATAHAEKSNQIRPTPSPLATTRIVPGELTLTPKVIYTVYDDSLLIKDLPGQTQNYHITSTGVTINADLGLARWAAIELGFEAYQKLGSITGPSPGDPTQLAEADVTGNAFKLAFQGHLRFFHYEKIESDDASLSSPGDCAFYLFARGVGDFFKQEQYEPLFHTDFRENSIEYRTGLVGQVHLWKGIYFVAFGGIDGVWFSGERRDTSETSEELVSLGGSELPYPFFGGDILWSPYVFGSSVNDAISLGAILAMTREDEAGFGGNVWTFNLSYTFRFNVYGERAAPVKTTVGESSPAPAPAPAPPAPVAEAPKPAPEPAAVQPAPAPEPEVQPPPAKKAPAKKTKKAQ